MTVRRSRTHLRRSLRHVTTTPARFLAVLAAAALLAAGCGSGQGGDSAGTDDARSTEPAFPVTVTDAGGEQVTIEDRPERIVALFDVNVNTLDELDVDERIVGIDDFAGVPDDTPDDVARVGGDNFAFDADTVVALEPDLVITSFGTEDVLDAQLRSAGLTVLSLPYPATLDETWKLFETLGDVTGEREQADELVDDVRERLDAVTDAASGVDPVTTYFETDASTPGKPFTVGDDTLVGDLLLRASGDNVFGDDGVAPQVSYESIVAAAPQVILLANAVGHVGPNFLGAVEPADVAARPGFSTIPAVADDRIFVIDADELLVPGPRLPEGLAQLVAALHPNLAEAAQAVAAP